MTETVIVIDQHGSLRLIKSGANGGDRYAVIEARDGCVYSMRSRDRRSALDTAAGMATVVAPDGWQSEPEARRAFIHLVQDGNRLSREIW